MCALLTVSDNMMSCGLCACQCGWLSVHLSVRVAVHLSDFACMSAKVLKYRAVVWRVVFSLVERNYNRK